MKAKNIQHVSLAPAVDITAAATVDGAALNIRDYEGDLKFTHDSSAGAGADNTNDVVIQHSDDGVTDWVNVVGGAFTQVTNAAAAFQTLTISTARLKAFVRKRETTAGTGIGFARSVSMIGEKKYN